MLGKLFKQELKATARIFLPIYLLLIAISIVNKLSWTFREWTDSWLPRELSQLPAATTSVLYVAVIVAVFVLNLVITIQRFYKNLLGDEGYLTLTLPLPPWMHIFTKLTVSVIWNVGSFLVVLFSVYLMTFDQFDIIRATERFWKGVRQFFSFINVETYLLFVESVFLAFAKLISDYLKIYASIAIGHLANRHRVLCAFGAYFGINTAFSFISGFFTLGLGILTGLFQLESTEFFLHFHIWVSTGEALLLSVLFFTVTNYILSKKLNLE